jgi:hypothetical protein
MPRRVTALVSIVAVLAGCGIGASPVTPEPPELPDPPRAERAPPPVEFEGPGLPDAVTELTAYGEDHPKTFGGMYVDPPGGTTVVMLFTGNLEAHAEAVGAILPGTRVRHVAHTKAELIALMVSLDLESMMAEGIEPLSAAFDTERNVVHLEIKSDDPTLELRLELAHAGMLEVTVFPLPGEWSHVTAGEGWRLLATGEASPEEAYVVRAATDSLEWAEMWETLQLGGEAPAVDFDSEVVVSFGEGIGSGCPEVRLDSVEITDGVVHSRTSDPLAPRDCELDLRGAAVFVVALKREALPAKGFTLRLRSDPISISPDVKVELP